MSTKRNWIGVFYGIGIAMTLACLAFVLASNTELVWRFEHSRFPLSWAFGAAAVLAFLAAEFCPLAVSVPNEAETTTSQQLSPEWEMAEF